MSAAQERPEVTAGDTNLRQFTCESCGSVELVVWAVHRIYVTPAEQGFEDLTETRERVMPEVEHWCLPCCASYPHVQIGAEES